jgi:hypothetical protein
MGKNVKANCTWGDGPDVLVSLDGMPFICHEDPKNDPPPKGQWVHGYVSRGSFDLTQAEARRLAYELLEAAETCKAMEDSYMISCNTYQDGDS